MKKEIIVLDTETGGLDHLRSGLCSVALKVFGREESLHLLIKPNPFLDYSSSAFNTNGLSAELLEEKGVSEEEAVRLIEDFIWTNFAEKPYCMGHNVGFDLRFLEALFSRHSKTFVNNKVHYNFLDTKVIAIFLHHAGLVKYYKHNLSFLYEYFTGKSPSGAHDAMNDVLMTEELYYALIKKVQEAE